MSLPLRLSSIFFLSVIPVTFVHAQCAMVPLSLADRVQQASVVVEGRITSQLSFWNEQQTMIYTAYRIDVYKIFKGAPHGPFLTIVAEGGTVGNRMITAHPNVSLQPGDAGIFLLTGNPYGLAGEAAGYLTCYGAAQGFIRYNTDARSAADPFFSYPSIRKDVYAPLLRLIGRSQYREVKAPDFFTDKKKSFAPPVISSFSPTATVAGKLSAHLLTITGSNFGASYVAGISKLEFKNSNDGGATYIAAPDNHIVSWSNTSITSWVPTGAGTGTIRVTNNLGEKGTSASSLTIYYNETNVISGGTYYLPDLVDDNGSGGYTFTYNTSFNSNTDAVAAFERALVTWRCGVYVHFTRSGTTSTGDNASDGINVVTFDGITALPAGVLGTAYSYYTSCASGVWYVSELDLKFRTNSTGGITWNYGPGATSGGKTDFESVALHELGHALQLGHTNQSPATVMHYALPTNTDRRTLTTASEVDGGNDIVARSGVNNSCGPTKMIALNSGNCSFALPPVADFSASSTTVCKNKTLNFTDLSTNSPTAWSWSFSGGTPSTSTVQHPTGIKYKTVGSFDVTLTASNAAGSDSETKTNYITVNSLPSVSVSAAPCSGGAVLLTATATPSTGITYQWKKNGSKISGATNSTYSATSNGEYKCEVKITATGCKKTSSGVTVTITCRTAEDHWTNAVSVYPNPSSSEFRLLLSHDLARSLICIRDLSGRLMECIRPQAETVYVGARWPAGTYLAEYHWDNRCVQVLRLVKE
ncbi:MAG: PKD domain-containing protein [Chitinophagales bacterium]|nr:PKD domain-containing protein [Chitinophagales bacterium]MDW8393149.1 PKD domain-containing protein [Chitinophagales bacterium]